MSSLVSEASNSDQLMRDFVDRTRRKHARLKLKQVVLGIGFPLALLLIWEYLAQSGAIDRRFFPAPSRILSSVGPFLTNEEERSRLLTDLAATLKRLSIGYGLGATFGITLGVIMGLNASARFAIAPLLYGIFPLPKIAIYPLMIVIFGLSDASTIALITLGVFFMTCINTLSGVRYTQSIYHDVAKVFRIPGPKRWFQVFIPAAMPAIITGLRLGLGQALILVVSAEFVSADTGVGRFIWDSWQTLNIPRMFIGLGCVLILATLAAMAGDFAERRLIPWKR